MLKVHAAGRIPLNRKEDEIYKVGILPLHPAWLYFGCAEAVGLDPRLAWERVVRLHPGVIDLTCICIRDRGAKKHVCR